MKTELEHFTETYRANWLDYLERRKEQMPINFEERAIRQAADDFSGMTPSQLSDWRLTRAVDAEVQRMGGGPVVRCRLPDGTPMRWNVLQNFMNHTQISDDAKVSVLHLHGKQPGGWPGTAERLIKILKGEGARKLIIALSGELFSASAWLLADADHVFATANSAVHIHCGHHDSQKPVWPWLPEDRHDYPNRELDAAAPKPDGHTWHALNVHGADRDAAAFLPRFQARLASAGGEGSVEQRLRNYFAAPIFTPGIRSKLLTALERALRDSSPDSPELMKAAQLQFWEILHTDFLFTKLTAAEGHALGAIDEVV